MPATHDIHLKSLRPRASRRSDSEERSPLRTSDREKQEDERGGSGSDFSSYLEDDIDELDDPLNEDRSRTPLTGRHSPAKEERYDTEAEPERKRLVKEEIPIPDPDPVRFKPSRFDVFLGIIMSGNVQRAKASGLVGKPLLYFTTVFVSLGVFLFGYDQGVMSGIITGPYFKQQFNNPGEAEIGTMIAILEVGAFISSLAIGKIGDWLGRKRTIRYGALIFFIGGALQTVSTAMPIMMLGRIIAGLGVGALSTIVPVYQSEISPPHNRGKLACIEFSGNILGYAASVWVDYGCSFIDTNMSWRIPLALQCFMGALLGFGTWIIPESPRWLLDTDHDEEGIVVIANLYGGGDIHDSKAKEEFREIKMNVLLQRQEGERSYRDIFRKYYRRIFIAMSSQFLAQANGINVISYYAPLLFESAGFYGREAILMTGFNSLTYLASTIPTWYVIDTLGRRKILMSGAIVMALALSLISYFLYIRIDLTPRLVVIMVIIYNAAFGFSWGPVPWLYPPEILPLSIRAKGASLSTATNWIANFAVGLLTPILQKAIGWRLYLIHAFSCSVSFILVYFIYPETAGIRLEDMDKLFGDATTAMPTPAQEAEIESLMSGNRSPVPSLDIRRPGNFTADNAIPGLDINPPAEEAKEGKSEGLGGWISSIVRRNRAGSRSAESGRYRQVEQDERR